MGTGLVMTAPHVVGPFSKTKPSVRFGDRVLPSKPIKEGSLEGGDLTLLSIDEEQLPVRRK
jgi:hypothetical protein